MNRRDSPLNGSHTLLRSKDPDGFHPSSCHSKVDHQHKPNGLYQYCNFNLLLNPLRPYLGHMMVEARK